MRLSHGDIITNEIFLFFPSQSLASVEAYRVVNSFKKKIKILSDDCKVRENKRMTGALRIGGIRQDWLLGLWS